MNEDLWDSVLQQAEKQRAKGMGKYGKPVTADQTVDWLEHAIEEHLDAAVYMEAAKSVLLKLTEEGQQLRKECADWLKLYSDESEALAESRKEVEGLKRLMEEEKHYTKEWQGIAESCTTKWNEAEEVVKSMKTTIDSLKKQRETEEAGWATVAKRLRSEAESAVKEMLRAKADLVAEKRFTSFTFFCGIAFGAGAATFLWFLL